MQKTSSTLLCPLRKEDSLMDKKAEFRNKWTNPPAQLYWASKIRQQQKYTLLKGSYLRATKSA